MFFDRKWIYIIMGLLILSNLMNLTTGGIVNLLISLPGFLIAITFHEFAHAFAADKLGDDTPRMQNRLNLNPLNHLDPVGSFLLLFAGFGWGKPVEINPRNFNRKLTMSQAEAIVSIAGPLMNFILAIVLSVILGLVMKFVNTTSTALVIIINMLLSAIAINVGLGIFNLIPLPPLDGSKILRNFLPYKARVWMDTNYQMLYIVFIVIWITPLASTIVSPIINGVYNGILNLILGLFGINI